MKSEVQKYLFDIKISIESIYEFLGQCRDYAAYLQNKMQRRAVERELEIIGEAMTKILKIDSSVEINNETSIKRAFFHELQ